MNAVKRFWLTSAVVLPLFAGGSMLMAADRTRDRASDRTGTKKVERKRDRIHVTAPAKARAKAAAGLAVSKRAPKAPSAAVRIRQQDRDGLCDECGYFVPRGEYVCDFCGTLCADRDADGDGIPNCEDEDFDRPRADRRDHDGDGVPNCEDEDYESPRDGSGYGRGRN